MYLVESYAGWFVTDATNKRIAHSEGVKEFGKGNVKSVTIATQNDIDAFIANKGEDALYSNRLIGQPK